MRLFHKSRAYFRNDDLAELLPLGIMEPMAIEGQTYTMAFTPGLLSIYQRKSEDGSNERLIVDASETLGADGGYVDLDDDGCWWTKSARSFFSPEEATPQLELLESRKNFFLPRRQVDPFGNAKVIDYDSHYLFEIRTIDAVGNIAKCQYDYRTLQPSLTIDANGNRSACTFDELGLVVAQAVMGKENERVGDSLDNFTLGSPELMREFLSDPRGPAAEALLGNATKRIVYDFTRFWLETDPGRKKPILKATIMRETHASETAPGALKTQISFSYYDGFGRPIQIKSQSGPTDGMETAWRTNGWIVYNNKGKPVRQYEPFFDKSHEFVSDTRFGVSPLFVYDPVGRLVTTISPNHSWKKTIFGPWQTQVFDENDTVLQSPKTDPDIGPLILLLPDEDCLPTWFEQRRTGDLGKAEQEAATKAALHADTPLVIHLDPLGREFLSIANNGERGCYRTMVKYDIQGQQRGVIDAKGRLVMQYDYNMAGIAIRHKSMDSGERWLLTDTAGVSLYSWDSRMQRLQTVYDPLRRPSLAVLQRESKAELVVEKITYGESLADAELYNVRGRVVHICDQAGTVTKDKYDFKGNLVLTERRLAKVYKSNLDWYGDVALEEQTFNTKATFDALNRPVETIMPDKSIVCPQYNEAGLLRRINARIRGERTWTPFIDGIEYNAKGQRTHVKYGNGTYSSFKYDPYTFAVVGIVTRRPSKTFSGDSPELPDSKWLGCYLQNLHYTYDAVENITRIGDNAQQTIFYRNKRVEPSAEYTYDALYRLLEATGREHLGTTSNAPDKRGKTSWTPVEHPHDGTAMSRYLESYQYDEVGNLQAVRHGGSNEEQSWTRRYAYEEASLLELDKHSNRLSGTSIGQVSEAYGYDADAGRHGDTTSMPRTPFMKWDYRDQLRATARQVTTHGAPETTWYVYDSTGQRVRKITERHAADGQEPTRLKERLYVGIEIFRRYNGQGEPALERETLVVKDDSGDLVTLVETRTEGHEPAKPERLVRYQLSNYLQSVNLELDGQGRVLTYEEYSPYGTTTYLASQSQLEAPKRYGYTGKERDEESGMYYYGARYYFPGIGRWVSCDPAGLVDGVDVYVYVRCNPVNLVDPDGRMFRWFKSLWGEKRDPPKNDPNRGLQQPPSGPSNPPASQSQSVTDEMPEAEKRDILGKTLNNLVEIGIPIIKQQEGSRVKLWHDSEIRTDRFEIKNAVNAALATDNGINEANSLRYHGLYDDAEAAKKGILDELERLYPDPQTRASEPAQADESPALQNFGYRYMERNYTGNAALVSYIIDKEVGLLRAGYGPTLIDMTIKKMATTAPPAPSTAVVNDEAAARRAAERILADRGPYVEAVVASYAQAVKETHGKKGEGTQIGRTATYSSYK